MGGVPRAGAGAVGVATAGLIVSGIYGLRSAKKGGVLTGEIAGMQVAPTKGSNAAKYMIFRD
jgi:hypothetical protein